MPGVCWNMMKALVAVASRHSTSCRQRSVLGENANKVHSTTSSRVSFLAFYIQHIVYNHNLQRENAGKKSTAIHALLDLDNIAHDNLCCLPNCEYRKKSNTGEYAAHLPEQPPCMTSDLLTDCDTHVQPWRFTRLIVQ